MIRVCILAICSVLLVMVGAPKLVGTAADIAFTPPFVSTADQQQPHEFVIQVAQFNQPLAGATVELSLSANGGPPRVFVAKSADGRRFSVSAVPVPDSSGAHSLRLTVKYPDSEILCTVKDQSVSVGGKSVKLSLIQHVEGDRITFADGRTVTGVLSGASVLTEVGGRTASLDLQRATEITVADTVGPIRAIDYRIVIRQGGKVVATETGQIKIAGATEAAARSRPDVELFVCSGESGEIKRFDGRTGAFLNDFAIGNGMRWPHNAAFGRDGRLYVSCGNGPVLRFSGQSGQFIDAFVGTGIENATGLAFGPDGNVYVADAWKNTIKRYDGKTGAFLGDFVKRDVGSLDVCGHIIFGPDGNLYAASLHSNLIKRYDGRTGAFLGDFAGRNGLNQPSGLVFGKDGCLYVGSAMSSEVKRFDGKTGAFLDTFIAAGAGGLLRPDGMAFGPDGNLYICDSGNSSVKRFNGHTGAFIDDFVPKGTAGLSGSAGLVFRSVGGRP
jgi:DNA-binding beta-propeller fold protein YncE